MKQLLRKKQLLAVCVLLGYLLGAALSVAFIGFYPIYVHQSGFFSLARNIAQEYLEGRDTELQSRRGPFTRILIYDENGIRLRYESTRDEAPAALDNYTARWMDEVLSGREIFAITKSEQNPLPGRFWLTTGVPILDGGYVRGAVFLIENLQNVQEAVLAYLFLFTLLYWISTWILLSYSMKKKKLELLRQTYVANVTHALKTPITSIHAMAEALGDGVVTDPEKQQVYYGLILQETNHQSRMVQEMLELSKLQSNSVDLRKSAVDAAEILSPIVENYTVLCDCTDVTLHVSEAVTALPTLYTNASAVRQILEIFLDNAVKFVPEGGDVWLDARIGRGSVTICVRDNGEGIEKKDLPRVFERFYRCSRSDSVSGSGLGLSIARELADGLGERIWAEAASEGGAAFCFTVRMK